MKAEMKLGACLALFLALSSAASMSINCNTRLLQYYGLEGLSHAIPYNVMEQINSDNFCPNLQQTCCTSEDFNLTRELWTESAAKVKGYLTQIFRTLQKIATIQSSIIQFMPKIQAKDTVACKKIDSTFFNSPVKFDEVYFYIRNALEAFAYIQKGFYCMLCDPSQHQYFQTRMNYGRFFVQMSQKSCDDLMFFFREFLAYRVYFFNPLVKNLNQVLNCVHDTDVQHFDFEHLVSYQGIADCLENKNYCWKVCKEFRFGISSNLFIGQLSQYKKMMQSMEELIAQMSRATAKFDELDFLDENFNGEFFARANDTVVLNNMNILKDMNLSKAELFFAEEGVDLFYTAVGANFFLTDASTLENVKKHYELLKPNADESTVLDATTQVPNTGYTEVPDLANTRINTDEQKQEILRKIAPPNMDMGVGEGQIRTVVGEPGQFDDSKEEAVGDSPVVNTKTVENLEQQYFDKMAKETTMATGTGTPTTSETVATAHSEEKSWWRYFVEKMGF
jgi:hypothetical protein